MKKNVFLFKLVFLLSVFGFLFVACSEDEKPKPVLVNTHWMAELQVEEVREGMADSVSARALDFISADSVVVYHYYGLSDDVASAQVEWDYEASVELGRYAYVYAYPEVRIKGEVDEILRFDGKVLNEILYCGTRTFTQVPRLVKP